MAGKKFRTAYFELTNVCNGNCPFCRGTKRISAFMSGTLFRKLVSESKNLVENAYLHVMGEALLHPEFISFSAFAHKNDFPLSLTTNGTLFGTPNAEALFSGAFRQVNISLHAGLAENCLEEVFEFVERSGRDAPRMYRNLRMWNTGTTGREAVLRKISRRFGVPVPEDRPEGPVRIGERLSVHFDHEFEWPELSGKFVPSNGTCRGAVRQFAVLCDGIVTPCCLDADGTINCGDASKRPLGEILSTGRFEKMRNAFLRGEVIENLCKNCSYRTRFGGIQRRALSE